MLQAFIVTLREGVEAALIVGITLAYLTKIGRTELRKTVYAALAAAFLGSIGDTTVVYKPIAGETPLWDFPDGFLAHREVAAYLVSRAAGWDVVPPTVMRDGPFGPGMCQLWIDHDADVDLIALSRRTDHAGLRDLIRRPDHESDQQPDYYACKRRFHLFLQFRSKVSVSKPTRSMQRRRPTARYRPHPRPRAER